MASGQILAQFFPGGYEPPASAYAIYDTRNGVPVLDFDDTTDWEAVWSAIMPDYYDGGGVTATVGWMAEDTTVGPDNAVWQAAFKSITDDADDLDTKAFASLNGSGAVAEASASGEVSENTITFTDGADMDSVAAGEFFQFKLRRDADDTSATDSLVGDAQVPYVILTET